MSARARDSLAIMAVLVLLAISSPSDSLSATLSNRAMMRSPVRASCLRDQSKFWNRPATTCLIWADPFPKLSEIQSTVLGFHSRTDLAERRDLVCSVAASSRTKGGSDLVDRLDLRGGASSSSEEETEY